MKRQRIKIREKMRVIKIGITKRKLAKSRKKVKAVMTVEASLILPIFIMLFMNLLSMIEAYRIHSSVAMSLWETGRDAAKYLYLEDAAEDKLDLLREAGVGKTGAVLTSLSAGNQIAADLENYPIWEKIVKGGRSGFLVTGETEKNGILRIDCSYGIQPLFASFTPISKVLKNHYYGHAWTGYALDGGKTEEEEIWVYITETGTVYHKNRGCSYLNPSIRSVSAEELDSLRNRGGGVYYECPLCNDFPAGVNYFVTDYGTNYHRSVSCSGLKRTIYAVKISEAGGRGACSKCGG